MKKGFQKRSGILDQRFASQNPGYGYSNELSNCDGSFGCPKVMLRIMIN